MNTHWKAVLCALGALAFALAPGVARAEEVYFLVGVRHIYRIGPNRDLHMHEREEIEKNYADGVAQDQDTFNQHVANGADRDKESEMLNSDLDALTDSRDKSLGSLFDQCDYMRDRHPELKIEGDGPYQVIGVDFHNEGDVEVVDRYCAYAPWPGYVLDGPCYGGWTWGVWYTPGVFIDLYWGWFDLWPGGRFWGGFCGHRGAFAFGPHGFNDRWHGGKVGRPGGFGHGGFGRGAQNGSLSGANRSAGASSRGGYTHSGSGFARSSGSANTRSGSGYSRSWDSSARSGGFSHYGSTNRSSEARSGGYSHSNFSRGGFGESRSSYSGGFGRSQSSQSYTGSGGFGRGQSSQSYTRSSDFGSRGGGYSRGASGGGSHSSSSSSSGSGRGGSGSHGRGR